MDANRLNVKNPAVKRLLQARLRAWRGGGRGARRAASHGAPPRGSHSHCATHGGPPAPALTRRARGAAQEYKELRTEQSRDFVCEPLEARLRCGTRGTRAWATRRC